MTPPREEALANSVPAAAVIRRVQALLGFTGLKGHVGLGDPRVKAFRSTEEQRVEIPDSRTVGERGTPGGAVKCVDIRRNAGGESDALGRP